MTTDTMIAPVWKPRVINGLITVELADGLLFEGAAQRQVLRGRHALSLLPRLVALLDGTATIDELAGVLPEVPADHLHRAVTLLASLGLIEEGGRRLDQAQVIIVADERPGLLLAQQLDALGIGETSTAAHGSLITRRLANGPRPDLVVVAEEPRDRRPIGRLDRHCAQASIPWLRTSINPAGGEIGPFFPPNGSPCYRCFLSQATADAHRQVTDPSIVEAWAALVAIEVVNVLTGPTNAGQVAAFDLDLWEDHRLTVPPNPACSSCSYPPCSPLPDCNEFLERR